MERLQDDANGRHSMKIKNWLAGGAMLAVAALPAVGIAAPKDGDPGITAPASTVLAGSNGDIHIGGVVANDLGPDNQQTKHASNAAPDAGRHTDPPPPPIIRD
jgi:hypothetical protein